MYEKAYIQTVVVDYSRRRGQEPCISRMFVRLNVLNYKEPDSKDDSQL